MSLTEETNTARGSAEVVGPLVDALRNVELAITPVRR
jgi:hypothetical protein